LPSCALSHTPLAGLNTGACITGDADCDGNASRTGGPLLGAGGADNHVLDKGEYAAIVLNFGLDNTAVFDPPEDNPSLAVLGGWLSQSVMVCRSVAGLQRLRRRLPTLSGLATGAGLSPMLCACVHG
jgi:hypothetical protein